MTEHVVIRQERSVAGTREHPEVGVFTQTHGGRHPGPWGRIAMGDRVWMKWSGGPIVASARVSGIRRFEQCSPEELRETTQEFSLYDHTAYWQSLPPSFSAMTIYLEDEEWLEEPIDPVARSRGSSWVVLDSDDLRKAWLEDAPSTRAEPNENKTRRSLPKRVRFKVLRRDGFTCNYCGRSAPDVRLHVDHKVSVADGGSDELSNLVTACASCNLGKGAESIR